MTPALSLYLMAAARAEPFMTSRRKVGAPQKPRPRGELVWIHLGAGQPQNAATALAGRISDERPGADFLVTSDDAPGTDAFPFLPRPPDYPRAAGEFLSAWRPDAGIWIGGPLWPALAARARQLGVPLLLANAGAELAVAHRTIPARELLGLFGWIGARAPSDAEALQRASRRPVEAIGTLQRALRPLDHDEAEHDHLTDALKARPVWYAVDVTASEIEALYAAQSIEQGASHRLLLILQPADRNALAAALERYGVRRSAQPAPPAGAAAFIADRPGEEGLWYRLSSVTFVGGSLAGPRALSDPFAPAALGSAIVHGPATEPYADHFAALAAAGAARQVRDAPGLGRAVGDLLAPDRAAALARQAWTVISEGAEATDRVVDEVGRILDAAG